jgi:hypothetical protein
LVFIFIASVGGKTNTEQYADQLLETGQFAAAPVRCGADTLLAVQQDVGLPVLFRAMSEDSQVRTFS